MTPSFAHLVYEGRVAEAVSLAQDLQPAAVSRHLLSDPVRYAQNIDSVNDFIHAWYATLMSAHQRADAVLVFGSQLTPAPDVEAGNDALTQRVLSASDVWLDRETHRDDASAGTNPHWVGSVVGGRLSDLVYSGRIEDAIAAARDLHPQAIHRILFLDDHRWLKDEKPADAFIRAWYAAMQSAYLRAEAAHTFSDTYMTELAPVPDAEFIGAHMKTEAIKQLLVTVSRACLGPELNDWATSPEQPMPAESTAKWQEIGRVLETLDFPPPIPLASTDSGDE